MIKVRGDRIVVKLPKLEQRLKGSELWIPVKAQEVSHEGIVLAVGDGEMVAEDVQVGDRVVFEPFAGLEHTDKEWGKVIILEFDDLQLVVNMEDLNNASTDKGGEKSFVH